jgi:hypothetical protein
VPEKNSGKREKLIAEAVPATEFLFSWWAEGRDRCTMLRWPRQAWNLFRCQIPSYRLQVLA